MSEDAPPTRKQIVNLLALTSYGGPIYEPPYEVRFQPKGRMEAHWVVRDANNSVVMRVKAATPLRVWIARFPTDGKLFVPLGDEHWPRFVDSP